MEEFTLQKSEWMAGPWQDEPDWTFFADKATNLRCYLARNPYSGSWCGYVQVPDNNQFYSKDYKDCLFGRCESDYCSQSVGEVLSVHGGVSYSDFLSKLPLYSWFQDTMISDVWVMGFDCIHWGDFMPGFQSMFNRVHPGSVSPGGVYRTLDYCILQCKNLALQIITIPDQVFATPHP